MLILEAVGSIVVALADAMVGWVQPQPYIKANIEISIKLTDVGEVTRAFLVPNFPEKVWG